MSLLLNYIINIIFSVLAEMYDGNTEINHGGWLEVIPPPYVFDFFPRIFDVHKVSNLVTIIS